MGYQVPGWGRTLAGPARTGRVGVPGRPAPTGVGALEVDALGSGGAVVLQAVCTLVPVCGREERNRTETVRNGQRLLGNRTATEQSSSQASLQQTVGGMKLGVSGVWRPQGGVPAQSPPPEACP